MTGLDVMEHVGKRGVDHQTGLNRCRPRVDAMRAGCSVDAFFRRHGMQEEDRPDVADAKDASTGLPVELYENGRYRGRRPW